MAFLELKGIGKIYVSEGSVGVGIRGVDLSFEKNEFVAITGESGSGKSTLLNVISGMDSYEEGEMYIEGEPTSHYVQQDFEEYRKKYISFIFQDYNIIDSMTVLQNVELSLMHVEDPKERRRKAIELLTRVGMEKHLHHKGSHLSGGQKQRTVIARALSKDSPIILADEPTGNLDSKSSQEIIELLYEVSRDKLVIIVTHSFDEVAPYATRHIRVFDGAIESDQQLRARPDAGKVVVSSPESGIGAGESAKEHNFRNGLILGRVRYFAKPKLSLFLSLMLILAGLVVTSMSAMFGNIPKIFEQPRMFEHIDGRVIITRKDGQIMSDSEVEEIASKSGASSYLHYDYLLDYTTNTAVEFKYDADVKPDYGRTPEKDNEIMLVLPYSDYEEYRKLENGEEDFYVSGIGWYSNVKYKLVGIKYIKDNRQGYTAVVTERGFRLATAINFFLGSSGNFALRAGVTGDRQFSNSYNYMVLSFDIGEGTYIINDYNLKNQLDSLEKEAAATGLKYSFTSSLIGKVTPRAYGRSNVRREYYEEYSVDYGGSKQGDYPVDGGVSMPLDSFVYSDTLPKDPELKEYQVILSPYIVEEFMEKMYYPVSYTQASLFFENDLSAHRAVKTLESEGYIAVPSDTTVKTIDLERIGNIFLLLFEAVIWVLVILFIAMLLGFVTTKAMGANAGEIGIMRSMGIPVKVIKISIFVQTFISLIPAYIIMILFAALAFRFPVTSRMFVYLYWYQYVIIALSLLVIDLRLSRKYVKKIFGSTVKKTLKGDEPV